jgi:hypothetical protein
LSFNQVPLPGYKPKAIVSRAVKAVPGILKKKNL